MRVLICYFSGTGNTRKVAEAYAECFEKQHGAETTVVKIEDDVKINVGDYDLIGIGYPVHAFNAPSIVLSFCKNLTWSAKTKNAFIFNTSGEPLKLNNISSLKTKSILRQRNLNVINEYHYCMPYNMIFRHGDHMAYRMWETAKKLIPLDVGDIVSGKPHELSSVFLGGFIAWIMRVEHWGGRFNGRLYKVDEKCVNCKMCVNVCPTHNIEIKDGKFKFGNKCIMCMRCAHLCKRDAIKTGLFNSWKVNGRYTFEKPETPNEEKYNQMLTKAYKKYFEECDLKIAVGYADLVSLQYVTEEEEKEAPVSENESLTVRI